MYSARIETSKSRSFYFDFDHDVIFDIDPLTGADIEVATIQGFQQIGKTVERLAVGGISRTIKGVILTQARAIEMLNILPAFTKGKLWVNEEYYCNIYVEKTPEIAKAKNGKINFTMQVYCNTPFWFEKKRQTIGIANTIELFSYPTELTEHIFSVSNTGTSANCINSGDVATDFILDFTATGTVTNFGIKNTVTNAVLKINTTIVSGDKVKVYKDNGKLKATKTTDGVTTSIFAYIDDDSELFSLDAGDNYLQTIASSDGMLSLLQCAITFYVPHMGVIV